MKTGFFFITISLCSAGYSSAHRYQADEPDHPVHGRIVGGEDAVYGEFPHQIALLSGGVDGILMCGGSLVAAQWVVTAGHCCNRQNPEDLGVSVGSHRLWEEDDDQENIPVNRVVLHPEYVSGSNINDICLLELEHPVTLGVHVAPIPLPSPQEEYDEGTLCTVTGWGATSSSGSSEVLQKVEVPIVSDYECEFAYFPIEVTGSMICAGLDQGGKDSCQGDSGGPLMCGNQLSGVVSWGKGCGEAGHPGVYTQTSYYVDWINKYIM